MFIKIILAVPLLLFVLLFLSKIRHQIFYRIFFVVLAAIGVFFVLKPDITTMLAHKIGVGRGTDLVMYLSVVFFFMFSVLLYAKLRKLEATQADLTRQISIGMAERMGR